MEMRQLYYFVAIAEEGSITRAAQQLHMAQPPLSRQLKALEEELGLPLFERNKKKRVLLTIQGRLFLDRVRKVLHGLDDAVNEVKELGKNISGTLAVGSTIYCSSIMLSKLIHFRTEYPYITFNMWEGDSTRLLELLEDREIDIAISSGNFEDHHFERKKVTTDHCVLMVPNSLAIHQTVMDLPEIAELPLILLRPSQGNGLYHSILEEFQRLNLNPNILCECHDSAMLINLVSMGFGATIVPASMIGTRLKKEFKTIQIDNNPWILEPTLLWRPNSYLPSAAKAFLELF